MLKRGFAFALALVMLVSVASGRGGSDAGWGHV